MTASNPTGRFSSRVEDYIKYRPSYPDGVLVLMAEQCGFHAASVVADLGSGTGILSELLLKNGNRVLGIEPNAEMRSAAEKLLADYPGFTSVPASAESTTLPDQSADFITVGQAFHWFQREPARREFARILKPGGWVVLVWNDRRFDGTAFLREYEALLQQYGTDYLTVRRQWDLGLEEFRAFTGSPHARLAVLENVQHLDLEALRGRTFSSSFTPERGHPAYEPMLRELDSIFRRNQSDGTVAFEYETKIFCSQLPEPGIGQVPAK